MCIRDRILTLQLACLTVSIHFNVLVDSGRRTLVSIISRSRGPQLDVKNKSSVNDFLFGPEPVCRLTLNKVFSYVLHHRVLEAWEAWMKLMRAVLGWTERVRAAGWMRYARLERGIAVEGNSRGGSDEECGQSPASELNDPPVHGPTQKSNRRR